MREVPSSTGRLPGSIAIVVGLLRVGTLLQMAPSAGAALTVSPHPRLTALSWAMATVALLGGAAVVLVRRRPLDDREASLDVFIATALTLLGGLTVPVAERTGSWVGYLGAYVIAVACSALDVRRTSLWIGLIVSLLAAELVYLAPVLATDAAAAAIGHLVTLALLPPLVWLCGREAFRLAREADDARAYAAAAARREEESRARHAMHNGAALMRLLVEGQGDADPRQDDLRAQLSTEVNRMRAYLAGSPMGADSPEDLAAVVRGATAQFAHLPLDVVVDLADGTLLEADVADDLRAAIVSLLLNASEHAHADRVVVHAYGMEDLGDAASWEVTVHDDGVGFSPDQMQGVGLREIVIDQMATHGVGTRISSLKGLGTTITLSSPSASAARDECDHQVGEVAR